MLRKNIRHRLRLIAVVSLPVVLLFLTAAGTVNSAQDNSGYDVLYIWGNDLRNLQDYKEELETQLGPEVVKNLRIIQRGDQYGIIYDSNTSALSSAKIAVRHSAVLGKAGLGDARAIKDENYHELYNVSYGRGSNLEVLTGHYQLIYHRLGAKVGKDLFIERSGDDRYTLIYRRQADKASVMAMAHYHGRLLIGTGISVSITREENNEVVFGESSFLDQVGKEADAAPASAPPETPLAEKQKKPAESVPVIIGNKKKRVTAAVAGVSSNLERKVEEYVRDLRRNGRVAKDEKTGWLVIDLTREKTLVDINVDKPYQAASMIKPFIALAYFHRVKEGKLVYGPMSKRKMEAMIQRSDNEATNWVLKQCGGPRAVQKILRRHYGHLFGKTSIVEYIPGGGRTYRNKASARDYGRFLVALWRRQLPHDKEIRRLMALPGRDRLYSGTPIPRGTLVYNKTGTTAKLCGDMGILAPQAKNGRRYPYVVVGIIEKQGKAGNYGHWKMARGNVIREISSMIYQEMKADYNLL